MSEKSWIVRGYMHQKEKLIMKRLILGIVVLFCVSCGGKGGSNADSNSARLDGAATLLPSSVDGVPCTSEALNDNDEVLLVCTTPITASQASSVVRLIVWDRNGEVVELPTITTQANFAGSVVRFFGSDRLVYLDLVYHDPGTEVGNGLIPDSTGTVRVTPDEVVEVFTDYGVRFSNDGKWEASVLYSDDSSTGAVKLVHQGSDVAVAGFPSGFSYPLVSSVNNKGEIGGSLVYAPDQDHQFAQEYGAIISEKGVELIPGDGRPELTYSRVVSINSRRDVLLESGIDSGVSATSANQDTNLPVSEISLVRRGGERVKLTAPLADASVVVARLNNRGYSHGAYFSNLTYASAEGLFRPDGSFISAQDLIQSADSSYVSIRGLSDDFALVVSYKYLDSGEETSESLLVRIQ